MDICFLSQISADIIINFETSGKDNFWKVILSRKVDCTWKLIRIHLNSLLEIRFSGVFRPKIFAEIDQNTKNYRKNHKNLPKKINRSLTETFLYPRKIFLHKFSSNMKLYRMCSSWFCLYKIPQSIFPWLDWLKKIKRLAAALLEKCPSTEFFSGPYKETPYLDTFHAVLVTGNS